MSVAAIVPARDEQHRVGATVEALRALGSLDEILVVDDASTDLTGEEAAAGGARVLRLHERLGKGGALARGVERTDAEVLLFVDADLGASAGGAGALLEPVLQGRLDMAIGAPPATDPSGLGLVEGTARLAIRALTGRRFARPLSGQRALRRAVLARARWPVEGFGVEVGLTIDALRAGFRVEEVPMLVEHRRTGRDIAGFRHRARQGLDVMRVSIARGVRFRTR